MTHFAAFGYGSLVNADTLPAATMARTATIHGWRRAWRVAGSSPKGNRCSLTVVPDADCTITGVVIAQPLHKKSGLDKREGWYRATPVVETGLTWLEDAPASWPQIAEPVGIFTAKDEHARSGDADHPVMLSYIDTVIAGYRARFGEAGVAHFLETTTDWHVPIFNDRANPCYPRAVALSQAEQDDVDSHLAALKVTIIHR